MALGGLFIDNLGTQLLDGQIKREALLTMVQEYFAAGLQLLVQALELCFAFGHHVLDRLLQVGLLFLAVLAELEDLDEQLLQVGLLLFKLVDLGLRLLRVHFELV